MTRIDHPNDGKPPTKEGGSPRLPIRDMRVISGWLNEEQGAGRADRYTRPSARPLFSGVSSVQNENHGGDVGRISSYSEVSCCSPMRAGIIVKTSPISTRMKILRNFVMNES